MADDLMQTGRTREQIRPTVIIGLGGTGKKVLLKIRRRFFDRYGSLRDFPSIAYLYLDTDTNDIDPLAEGGGHQIVADGIDFANQEKVSITVGSTLDYVDNPKDYPHVSDWFYPNLRDKANLTQGAGAIRPYGRLAFFHNYERIRNAVQNAVDQVTDIESLRATNKKGIKVVTDSDVDIFIVGSVAGGTGSGMLLDTTFLLSMIRPSAKRYGFVALPKVFGPRYSREGWYANGYAALKEINHFTHRADANKVRGVEELTSAHNFRGWWRPQDDRSLAGPPFHYLYLVDGVNEKGITAGQDGINEMMADAIFYEFAMSEFGTQKRSIRDNSDVFLCDVAVLKDDDESTLNRPQPKHYSSFGLSRITFPVDQVKGAVGARLAKQVVSQWQRADGEISPQQIEEFLQRTFLPQLGLTEPRQRDHRSSLIWRDLQQGSRENSSVFQELVDRFVGDLRTEANRRAATAPLAKLLRDKLQEQEIKLEGWASDYESDWRDLARQLRSNLQRKQERVRTEMETKIKDLLADPSKSLAWAVATLDRLHGILLEEKTGYLAHYQDEKQRAERDRDALQRQMNAALSELELDGDRMAPLPVWRPLTRRFLAERALNLMKDYLTAHVKAAVAANAIRFCRWLVDELKEENQSGLRTGLFNLQRTLSRIQERLDAQEKRFLEVPTHSHQIVLFDKADFDGHYRFLVGEKEQEKVRDLAGRALQAFGGNLLKLQSAVAGMRADEPVEILLQLCARDYADTLHANPRFEAMRLFRERFKADDEQANQLKQLFDAARPWIQFTQAKAGVEPPKMDQRFLCVGMYVPDNAPSEYEDFSRQLKNAAGNDIRFKANRTDTRNEIVIYWEVAGYPLFLMNGMDEMGQVYLEQRDKEARLHIDHHEAKFGDPMPKLGAQFRQYREAVRNFVLAQAMGLLQVQRHHATNQAVWVFPVERGLGQKPRMEHLGYEDTSIERLMARPQLRELLAQQVDRSLALLQSRGPEAMAALYAVLAWYEEGVYPSTAMEAAGGAIKHEYSLPYSVIQSELDRIRKDWGEDLVFQTLAEQTLAQLRHNGYSEYTAALAPDMPELQNRVFLNLG